MRTDDLRRLRKLENENARLRTQLAHEADIHETLLRLETIDENAAKLSDFHFGDTPEQRAAASKNIWLIIKTVRVLKRQIRSYYATFIK